MKACALVIRVSDARQGERPDSSPENQRVQLERYIEFRNSQVEKDSDERLSFFKEYRLLGVKGSESFDSREFADMREEIACGHIDVVMATGLDRFGRNVKKFLEFFEFLQKHDVELVVTHYQIDTATPTGQLVITILMALAEMQREQLSQKIATSRHILASKGRKSGGSVPLGFDRDPDRPGYYKVNEAEAETVRLIFSLYMQHGNLRKTAQLVNSKGLRTKESIDRKNEHTGGKKFTSETIRYVLQNMIYIGILEEHKQNKGKPDSEIPENDRYTAYIPDNPDDWPKIVEEEVFYAVQTKLGQRASTNKKGARKTYPYHLAGLIQCSVCGQSMHSQKGKNQHYYACMNKDCPARKTIPKIFPRLKRNTIDAVVLEDAVQRLIQESVLAKPAEIKSLTRIVNQELAGRLPGVRTECKALRARLDKAHSRKQGIQIALNESGDTPKQVMRLKKDLEAVMDEIASLEERLTNKEEESRALEGTMVKESAVRQALELLAKANTLIPENQMKELFRLFFDGIRVGLEEIEVHLALETIMYLARKRPDPSSFDWCQGWYARQELNPQPTGP